jgi:hypothetical protein
LKSDGARLQPEALGHFLDEQGFGDVGRFVGFQ